MKPWLVVVGLLLICVADTSAAAMPVTVPMTAARWQTEGSAEFQQYKGVETLAIKKGTAVASGITFRNGTIELDVEAPEAMGAGIGFRRRDNNTYEMFYLRPRPQCENAPDCMQYTPQTHGVLLWDLYPHYQAPAPLRIGEWNHLKLVVSGRRMNVYVNGAASPTLKVGRLEGDVMEGGLLLQGPGSFANLTVTPDAVDGLNPTPETDPTADDRRFIRNWKLAPSYELAADKEPGIADLPAPSAGWRTLTAESRGLLNISRQYGLPLPRSKRSVAWLKATVTSGKRQTVQAAIGWSREVWVFVNGKLVYADKNLYQPPSARKAPDGRCSIENGSFSLPLNAGDNEVAVAVANNFYGWGLILRLDDADGVRTALR